MTRLEDLIGRLRLCWHVLRGWSVLSGLEINHGEVWFTGTTRQSGNLALANHARILNCQVWTRGQVVFKGPGEHSGNTGTAIADGAE